VKHEPPAPPELFTHDGLAGALFLPERPATNGIVIHHGAGSAKESHFDFARAARARGMAALAFDARGHGRSEGTFGASAVQDTLAMCDLLRSHAPHVALRGSSLGGFVAIVAAAAAGGGVEAVVAICPAPADLLMRGVRAGTLEFDADDSLAPWLESVSLSEVAARLPAALLLLHARGDEQVPYTVSEQLYAVAREPKRLLVLPGGHHRSLQHDPEIQAESLRWLERVQPLVG
jgi:uncharacterized protein